MGAKVRGLKGTYRYLTFGLLTLLISTSLAFSTFGGQFEDAVFAYERGDYAKAYRLFKPLAEQGVPAAQYNLGLMYADGLGVPQDHVLAHMWINLATSRYPASEKEKQEGAAKIRDLAASMMTPAQIAEAERLAREWKPKRRGESGLSL